MPPEYDASFVASTHGFIDLHEAWRKDPLLWRLTLDVYPELDPDGSRAARLKEKQEDRILRTIAEVHILLQMLRLAQDVYLRLNLEKYYAHPLNRGWMDVFFRWANSRTFRRLWPTLRAEFGRDFVRFCERQMGIGEVTGLHVALDRNKIKNIPSRLLQEFENEWPRWLLEEFTRKWPHDRPTQTTGAEGSGVTVFGNLKEIIKASDTRVWAIYPVYSSESHADDAARMKLLERGKLPAGLIVVRPNLGAGSATLREYLMLVWQRGAYRNAGLGLPAVESVLAELERLIRDPFRLRVCLPAAHLTGPGGALQKSIWLGFFSQLNFVRTRPPEDDEQATMLELHRSFRIDDSPSDAR